MIIPRNTQLCNDCGEPDHDDFYARDTDSADVRAHFSECVKNLLRRIKRLEKLHLIDLENDDA